MNNKIKIGLLAIIILIIIGFSLIIKNHQSKELKDLLKSPMANIQLTTGEEMKRSYYDRGTVLGKPGYVAIMISYQPKPGQSKTDLFNELANNMKQIINNSEEITLDEHGSYDGENENINELIKRENRMKYYTSFVYKKYLRLKVGVSPDSDKETVSISIRSRGEYPEIDFLFIIKDFFTL